MLNIVVRRSSKFSISLPALAASGRLRLAGALGCLLIAGLAHNCAGQTLSDQVLDRVNRLRAIVPLAEVLKDQREQVLSSLSDVEASVRDGQNYLALYRLQTLWTGIQPVEYARSKAADSKEGPAQFERAWRRLSTELKSKEASIDRQMRAGLPQAIRGLIEMCLIKSQAYYESSRPFGEDTQLRYGYYYMGVASAYLDFALMCLKTDFPGQLSAPASRSLGRELEQLDAKVVETYKQRDKPALVEEFIALSSNVEFAIQLERARRYDGALIAYLDAALKLGLLETPDQQAGSTAELTARLDGIAARLGAGNRDNSVGMIYAASARLALAHATTAARPSEDLKKAAVLIDRILPAYLNIISEAK